MTFPSLGVWYPLRQHFKFGSPVIDASLILQGPPAVGQGIGFVVRAPRAGRVHGFAYLAGVQQGSLAVWNFGLWRTSGGLPSTQVCSGNVNDAQLASNVWHEVTFGNSFEVEKFEPIACTIVAGAPTALSRYDMKYILGPVNNWLAAPYTVTKANAGAAWIHGLAETLPCLALRYLGVEEYGVPFGCHPATQLGAGLQRSIAAFEEMGFRVTMPFTATCDGMSILTVNDGTSLQARLYDANRVLLREGPRLLQAQVFDTDAEYFSTYWDPIQLDGGAIYYGVLSAHGSTNKILAYDAVSAAITSLDDGNFFRTHRVLPIGPFTTHGDQRVWAALHFGDVVTGGEPGTPPLALFFNPCPQECPDDPAPAVGQVVAPAGVSGAMSVPMDCGSPFVVTPCDPTYPA